MLICHYYVIQFPFDLQTLNFDFDFYVQPISTFAFLLFRIYSPRLQLKFEYPIQLFKLVSFYDYTSSKSCALYVPRNMTHDKNDFIVDVLLIDAHLPASIGADERQRALARKKSIQFRYQAQYKTSKFWAVFNTVWVLQEQL